MPAAFLEGQFLRNRFVFRAPDGDRSEPLSKICIYKNPGNGKLFATAEEAEYFDLHHQANAGSISVSVWIQNNFLVEDIISCDKATIIESIATKFASHYQLNKESIDAVIRAELMGSYLLGSADSRSETAFLRVDTYRDFTSGSFSAEVERRCRFWLRPLESDAAFPVSLWSRDRSLGLSLKRVIAQSSEELLDQATVAIEQRCGTDEQLRVVAVLEEQWLIDDIELNTTDRESLRLRVDVYRDTRSGKTWTVAERWGMYQLRPAGHQLPGHVEVWAADNQLA